HEHDLYSLAARIETLLALPRADHRIAWPAGALPAGTGLRVWAGVCARGQWKLSAVHGTGRRGHVDSLHVRFFRHLDSVGQAVRLPEGDAGGSGVAHADYAG